MSNDHRLLDPFISPKKSRVAKKSLIAMFHTVLQTDWRVEPDRKGGDCT
jgi:hypothetical protein